MVTKQATSIPVEISADDVWLAVEANQNARRVAQVEGHNNTCARFDQTLAQMLKDTDPESPMQQAIMEARDVIVRAVLWEMETQVRTCTHVKVSEIVWDKDEDEEIDLIDMGELPETVEVTLHRRRYLVENEMLEDAGIDETLDRISDRYGYCVSGCKITPSDW